MAGDPSNGRAPRRWVTLLPWLAFSLLLAASTFWFLRPRLPAAIEIAGHSMLPTLWGSSLEMSCQDCGYPLRCSSPLDAATIHCPNCGHAENPVSSAVEREPDQVRLVPLPRGSGPARWDLVAVRLPAESGYAVKRVVGLPGELISIEGGEIFADGQLLQKSWQLFQQLRVEVHHPLYQPASLDGGPSSWKPEQLPTGWTTSFPFHFQPRGKDLLDYLSLNRRPAIPGLATPPGQPLAGIVDYQPANQGLSRPRLHQVSDLMVEAQVAATDPAGFHLEIRRGDASYRLEVNFQKHQVELQSGEKVLSSHPLSSPASPRLRIGLAVYDRQIVLSGDAGMQLVPLEMDHHVGSAALIMIGALGDPLQVTGLRVWRDIHWLGPGLTDQSWSSGSRLQEDEYFLLGDNVPVSEDSRQWRTAVRRRDMLGTVR